MLSANNNYRPTIRVRNISTDDFEHHDEQTYTRTTGEPPQFLKDNFDYEHFEKLALSNVGLKHDDHDDNLEGHFLERSYVKRGGVIVDISSEEGMNGEKHFATGEAVLDQHSDEEPQQVSMKKLPKVPLLEEMNKPTSSEEGNQQMLNKPGRHYFAPVEATREEKIAYIKKVGRTLFMVFLVILMSAMVAIDYISNPKNTWVIRLSIFVSMVILWRFLYEYLFEILFEWMLEYFIYKEKKNIV